MWMSLLAGTLTLVPSVHVVSAQSTTSIETRLFSHSLFVPPQKIRSPFCFLYGGTYVRITFTASAPIDFFCQNSWEFIESNSSKWLKVSAHWSEKTTTLNRTYTIPTTDTWYFTLANYESYGIDIYSVELYQIDIYEIHVESDKNNYTMSEHATIMATMNKNDRPAAGLMVTLEVANLDRTVVLSQDNQTNTQGKVEATFALPHEDGQYWATAKTTISGVAIEDSVLFTITKDVSPPTTLANYNGSWYTANFTIALTAIDNETGVFETYYRINNGPTLDVSIHGQPQITTESANNTLEYWSSDKASNEETPHKILTDIKLDKTPPIGSMLINENATYANSTSVILTLIAGDATSGVYQVRLSNDGLYDTELWENHSHTRPWILMTGDGVKRVYCQIKDNAGLVSDIYSDTIILDTASPAGFITINGEAAYVATTTVTLALSATDATSGVTEMRLSNDDITYTEWQTYVTSKPWNLQDGDGVKTVHVQFKDRLEWISTYSDTIVLDTVPPTGFVAIAGGATYINSTEVALTLSANDATSGVTQMRFSNDNTTWSNWEAYAASKAWTLPSEDGIKRVFVQYRDNAGLVSLYSDSITLDMTSPTANAGSDQTVYQGTLVTFDASASSDKNGIATYMWSFTDVTPKTLTGVKPTYMFITQGAYVIALSVTDTAGNFAANTTTITVLESAEPIADAGVNQTANAGAIVAFDARASSDDVGIISYQWDFGDGTAGTGATTNHTYTSPGKYTVTLTVKNSIDKIDTDQVTITVLPEEFPMWIISTIIAGTAIGTAMIATIIWRRRKQ